MPSIVLPVVISYCTSNFFHQKSRVTHLAARPFSHTKISAYQRPNIAGVPWHIPLSRSSDSRIGRTSISPASLFCLPSFPVTDLRQGTETLRSQRRFRWGLYPIHYSSTAVVGCGRHLKDRFNCHALARGYIRLSLYFGFIISPWLLFWYRQKQVIFVLLC